MNNKYQVSQWHRLIKRVMDIVLSLTGIIFLSPLIIYVALRVKASSAGPVLYLQERVGYKGKIFRIRKFRSMYKDAEMDGPRLSENNDTRITPWGRTMRKWKLDELPQFWNVLIGEMSFVGPRPEREFYVRQIEQLQPSYRSLLQVKPGITSLGMISFGYAENIAEMAERMKYDMHYIQNRSIVMDIRIIISTVRIIFMAKGR